MNVQRYDIDPGIYIARSADPREWLEEFDEGGVVLYENFADALVDAVERAVERVEAQRDGFMHATGTSPGHWLVRIYDDCIAAARGDAP